MWFVPLHPFLCQTPFAIIDFFKEKSMPTRKEFFRSCFAILLAGVGSLSVFGKKGAEVKKETDKEKEKKMIAKCGIVCSECPAYVATQKNDDTLRAETARKWSEMFKFDIKAADINCDGCSSDTGRLFNYCNVCEIRKCANEKKLATCAACPEYSCQKLDAFLAQVPEARKMLEELRKKAKG
jgi:hypothetical protein